MSNGYDQAAEPPDPAEYRSPPPPPPPPLKQPVDISKFDPDAFLQGGNTQKPWDPISPSNIGEQALHGAIGFNKGLTQTLRTPSKFLLPPHLRDQLKTVVQHYGWNKPEEGTAESVGAMGGRMAPYLPLAEVLGPAGAELGAASPVAPGAASALGRVAGNAASAGMIGQAAGRSPDERAEDAKWAAGLAGALGLAAPAAARLAAIPGARTIMGHAINAGLGALGFGERGLIAGLWGGRHSLGHVIAEHLPSVLQRVQRVTPEIGAAGGPAARQVTPPSAGGAPAQGFDPDAFLRGAGGGSEPQAPAPPPPRSPSPPSPPPPAAGPWKPAPPSPLTLPE